MKKFFPYTIYALITAAIMWPLYHRGFVFLLDMIFPPVLQLKDYFEEGIPSQLPLLLILKTLNLLMPMDVVQKILLSALLFLPAMLMYTLAKNQLGTEEKGERTEEDLSPQSSSLTPESSVLSPRLWAFFAGLIYMLNPWTYERFLSGHWYVYLGYAVFPFFILLTQRMFENKTRKSFIAWLILAALYPIINFHWAYMAAGFFAVYFLIHFFVGKQSLPKFKQLALAVVVAAVTIVVVNSYWAFEFSKPQRDFNQISTNDLSAYATLSDPVHGAFVNVISLYGFWNQDYALPKDSFNFWLLISGMLLVLSVIGAVAAWRQKRWLLVTAAVVFIPALVLAVGAASPLSKPIVEFLFDYLPGFKGLRETQKIAGLLAFGYAVLAPLGAKTLTSFVVSVFDKAWSKAVFATLFICFSLLPPMSVYSAFWGFGGQVKTSQYPQSWFAAEDYLVSQDNVENVLFLPWYGYMRFPFTNYKLTANPSERFFDVSVIAGKNIENYNLPEYGESEIDQIIDGTVVTQLLTQGAVDYLKSLNVTHIVLVDELDRDKYSFLNESEYLEKSLEFPDLIVYTIKD